MPELIFHVEEAPEGGLTAKALGEAIFTEADGPADLYDKVKDAVRCHFDEAQVPKVIRQGPVARALTFNAMSSYNSGHVTPAQIRRHLRCDDAGSHAGD